MTRNGMNYFYLFEFEPGFFLILGPLGGRLEEDQYFRKLLSNGFWVGPAGSAGTLQVFKEP